MDKKCTCVLYSSSYRPLSPLSPPHSPLAVITMFLISKSLVIFCLLFSFVDYVPVKGEMIWYLSLTVWLISLSIMLSSSIHAIPSHTSHSGQHKQINKQVLERIRSKGNPSTLLLGIQTGEATVENGMEYPQKTKNGTAL